MFALEIKTDNAAFADPYGEYTAESTELARILHGIANQLAEGDFFRGNPVRDINGNTVGQFSVDSD